MVRILVLWSACWTFSLTKAETLLEACSGPCLKDRQCDWGLNCFKLAHHDGHEVPGCPVEDTPLFEDPRYGYCYIPPDGELVLMGNKNRPETAGAYPLQACQGDCAQDGDCDFGLVCYQRDNRSPIPGCTGRGQAGWDYCSAPENDHTLVLMAMNGAPENAYPLQECQGHCTNDDQCDDGLVCQKRSDDSPIVGCLGTGHPGRDYCGRPVDNRELELVASPGGLPESAFPLLPCQGHCKEDSDCIGNFVCIEGPADQLKVPGCSGDVSPDRNYCSGMTYLPGHRTVHEHGLELSQGLTARIIARSGKKVTLRRGLKSEEEFHTLPDGAAVFQNPDGNGGWAYVSNSEDSLNGGVGAIYFDKVGRVIDYERILSGSKRNCGGGKTWWGTFMSCEEHGGNPKVWEVDPWSKESRSTIIDGAVGSWYESAAYDKRNPTDPKFFVTMDRYDGPLLRLSPDPLAVQEAIANNDYSNLLHSDTGNEVFEYLVLHYDSNVATNSPAHLGGGTFEWTADHEDGADSAVLHYQYAEGLDVRDGMLYMTTKREKLLFILNLDEMTFDEFSAQSGAFDSAPDQIRSILRQEDEQADGEMILYFCEDGGEHCGVHGRDTNGNFYTVLQAEDPELWGETTGLAFSPDYRFMYVSFQKPGIIFEVRRTDGWPFNGGILDIKYHEDVE